MKKIIILIFLSIMFVGIAQAEELGDRLSGKILLQVEDKGQAWYVDPVTNYRAFLGRPSEAFKIMRELGLGISEDTYKKFNGIASESLAGRILLRVEAHGEAYYVNPDNFVMYYLGRPTDAFQIMRSQGLGIKTGELEKIAISGLYQERTVKPVLPDGEKYYSVFSLMNDVYKIVKVVDGDTVDVLIGNETKRVRIIGVDTPEVVDPRQGVECFGPEASDYAKKLLENKYVRLEIDTAQNEVDKYGRLLRHIFMENGDNFAEKMIADGYASEYTYITPSKYQKEYKLAESEARLAKLGLWQDRICNNYLTAEDKVQKNTYASLLEIANIFYNGSEGELEPDEYVEIKNNGEAINLKNYKLQDKGGKVFVFPDFTLANNASVKIFTGCGVNTGTELYWCYQNSAIWNNTGDEAELKNPAGDLLATYSY